jgi:hypothetical protein
MDPRIFPIRYIALHYTVEEENNKTRHGELSKARWRISDVRLSD